MNKSFKYQLTFILFVSLYSTQHLQSQSFEENLNDGSFSFAPSFHGIQIDGFLFFNIYGATGQFDFDFFSNINRNLCIGTRLSVEHYYQFNFVDNSNYDHSTNYNLFARLGKRFDFVSISILGGITYFTTQALSVQYLFRAGFEVKLGGIVGLVMKGSTSFVENSSFFGTGVYLGFDHNY